MGLSEFVELSELMLLLVLVLGLGLVSENLSSINLLILCWINDLSETKHLHPNLRASMRILLL